MQVNNSVYPNESQMQGFAEPGPPGPIYMVNLLKEDGSDESLQHVTW